MLKEIILYIKYPYTAGIIAIIWLGSAILMAINRDLDGVHMVVIDTVTSVIIAAIGFSGKDA